MRSNLITRSLDSMNDIKELLKCAQDDLDHAERLMADTSLSAMNEIILIRNDFQDALQKLKSGLAFAHVDFSRATYRSKYEPATNA